MIERLRGRRVQEWKTGGWMEKERWVWSMKSYNSVNKGSSRLDTVDATDPDISCD